MKLKNLTVEMYRNTVSMNSTDETIVEVYFNLYYCNFKLIYVNINIIIYY